MYACATRAAGFVCPPGRARVVIRRRPRPGVVAGRAGAARDPRGADPAAVARSGWMLDPGRQV
jgi:hypothetical protein